MGGQTQCTTPLPRQTRIQNMDYAQVFRIQNIGIYPKEKINRHWKAIGRPGLFRIGKSNRNRNQIESARIGMEPVHIESNRNRNNDSTIFHETGLHKPEFDETWAGLIYASRRFSWCYSRKNKFCEQKIMGKL